MKMKKFILILAAVIGSAFRLAAQEQTGVEKPDFSFDKKTYTLKPNENLVLEVRANQAEDWTASQWGLYAYFPNVPKAFPKESGLKIENPKSKWGLVRIVPFRRLPLAKDGKYVLSIPTQRWPEGCYSLVFSGIFLKKTPQGTGKSYSVRKNIYVVIEE